MQLKGFRAQDVEPIEDFDLIEPGYYPAEIVKSEMKETKNGKGQYLELSFRISEGEFENRRLWSRLNLSNNSEQAMEIAQRELSAICRAVGVLEPDDSSDLHGIPLFINVKQRKREDNGEFTNVIKGYKAVENKTVQAVQEQFNGEIVPETKSETGNKKPWEV